LLGGHFAVPSAIQLPLRAYNPDRRDFVLAGLFRTAEAKIQKAEAVREKQRQNVIPKFLHITGNGTLGAVVRAPSVERASREWMLAELDAQIASGEQTNLQAITQVEQLEEAGKKESAKWKELATGAVELQRKLSVLQARRDCLAARQESLAHPKNQRDQPQKKLSRGGESVGSSGN